MNTPIPPKGPQNLPQAAPTQPKKPTALGTILSVEQSKDKPKAFAKTRAAISLTKNVLAPLILGQTYKRIVPQGLRFKRIDDYIERTTNTMTLRELILPLMKWGMSFMSTGTSKNNFLEKIIGKENIVAFANANWNYMMNAPAAEDALTWTWYTFVAGYVSNPKAMKSLIEEVTQMDTFLKNKFFFLSSEKMWGGDTLRRAVVNLMHVLTDIFLIAPSKLHSQKGKYSWAGTVLASNFIGGVRIGEYFNASYLKKMGLGALGVAASYGSVVSTVALATSAAGITSLSTSSTLGLMLQGSALYVKDPKLQALLTAGNIGFQFLGPLSSVYQAIDSATGLGSFLALSAVTGGGLLYLHSKHPEILQSLGERSDAFNAMDWYTAEDFSKQKGTIEKNDFNPDNLIENRYRYQQTAFQEIQTAMGAIETNSNAQQTLLSEIEAIKKEAEHLKWIEGDAQPKAKNSANSAVHDKQIEALKLLKAKEDELENLVRESNALYDNYNEIIEKHPVLKLEVAKLEAMRLKMLQEVIEEEALVLKSKLTASQQTSALSWLDGWLEKEKSLDVAAQKKKTQDELQKMRSDTHEMFEQFWQFANTLDKATFKALKKEWKDIFSSKVNLHYGKILDEKEIYQFENINKQQFFLKNHLETIVQKVQASMASQVTAAEASVYEQSEAMQEKFQAEYEAQIKATTEQFTNLLEIVQPSVETAESTPIENQLTIQEKVKGIEEKFQAAHEQFVTHNVETILTGIQGLQDGNASENDMREQIAKLNSETEAMLQAAKAAEEQYQAEQIGSNVAEQVAQADIQTDEQLMTELRNKHREKIQATLKKIQELNVTRLNPLGKGARGGVEVITETKGADQEVITTLKVNESNYTKVSLKENNAVENDAIEDIRFLYEASIKGLDSKEEIDLLTLPALQSKIIEFGADKNRQEAFNDEIFLNEKVFIQDKSLKVMEEKWRQASEESAVLEMYGEDERFSNFREIFNQNDKLTNFASNLFSPKDIQAYEAALKGIIETRVDDDHLIVVNDAENSKRKLKIDVQNPTFKFKIIPPEDGLPFMKVSIEATYKALGEWQVEKDGIVDYNDQKQQDSFVRAHVLLDFQYTEPERKKGWRSWWNTPSDLSFNPSLNYAGIIAKVSEEITLPTANPLNA